VQGATSLQTTRFACHAVIKSYAKTVSISALRGHQHSLINLQGQASLSEACPVCLHEPVKQEDCKPNKALRTTVRIFLKKRSIDRENARKKELLEKAAAATPATPSLAETSAPQPSETPAPSASDVVTNHVEAKQSSREQSQPPQVPKEAEAKAADAVVPTEAQKDIPQMSIEVSFTPWVYTTPAADHFSVTRC